MFRKQHLLWLVPVALLLIGCAIWNIPLRIFWEIALLAWFTLAPGYALVRWIRMPETTPSQQFALSCAIGMGLTVLVRMVLHQLYAIEHTAAIVSGLTAIALVWGYIIKRPREANTKSNEWPALAGLAGICALLTVIYNFLGIHYTSDGALAMRGLFAIDVPYLIGNMPSLDIYGRMHDMHQNGLWFPYHDHVYRAISVAHQVGGDYFSYIAYSFPFFGSVCASISLFALFRLKFDVRNALLATLAVLLVTSSWGDHLLTGALSPSYLGGIVYACAIVILAYIMHRAEGTGRRLALWILLGLSLGALAKTKLPLFAITGGALGIVALIYIKEHTRTSVRLLLACILSLIFALRTSGSSPYQPANDFVIGAPLQGYANQLARVVGTTPAEVDAIISPSALETADLLFIPYAIFHFLRMIVLDARLLLFVLALIVTRKTRTNSERMIARFGIAAFVMGIAMPVLYSPAWYPLAISFYTLEIAGMVGLICAALLLLPRWTEMRGSWSKYAMIACVAYGAISTSLHIARQANAKSYTLSTDEVKATEWLRQNTRAMDVIASTRTDLDLSDTVNDESFYLYGALTQRRFVSEGAKYGALLSAVADTDTVKGLHPIGGARERLDMNRATMRSGGFDFLLTYDSTGIASPPLSRAFKSGEAAVWMYY